MITKEIETLRDLVADTADYSRIWLQFIPSKYTAGELSIRYAGDSSFDETGYHYRLDRDYQFVYFGDSEFDCIRKASAIQRKVNNAKPLRIKDSDNVMRLGSFSFGRPYQAEDDIVYFIIGISQAQVRQAREFDPVEKIQEINADIIDN